MDEPLSVAQLLTGGGIAGLVSAAVVLYRTLRSGAARTRRDLDAASSRALGECERALRDARDDAEYWRYLAGGYAGQLARAGVTPVPEYATLVPPSRRTEQRGRRTVARKGSDDSEWE